MYSYKRKMAYSRKQRSVWWEGNDAQKRGEGLETCPYPIGARHRVDWEKGWAFAEDLPWESNKRPPMEVIHARNAYQEVPRNVLRKRSVGRQTIYVIFYQDKLPVRAATWQRVVYETPHGYRFRTPDGTWGILEKSAKGRLTWVTTVA